MDGYAVRAAEVANVPVRLKVIGVAAAGRGFGGTVGAGQAVRILTGAPLPEGADTIVIQENARRVADDVIEVFETVAAGRHIRLRGLDFAQGDTLLAAGRVLDPAALSLAASANHASLDVVGRPLVAIIATGDELMLPGTEPGPDQIIASNAYGVAAIAAAAGARVLDLGIVGDDPNAIAERISDATRAGADVIVTLGGASVGDHDLVHDVLGTQGVTLDFWKIAMRPGKPLMYGRRGEQRFLGMPGNPVASLVCSHLFLKPLVARLGGRQAEQDIRTARLGAADVGERPPAGLCPCRSSVEGDVLTATPYPVQDSSMLRTLADSGGLIIRPPFAPAAAEGDACTVLMLR